jgi:hypothetical protein
MEPAELNERDLYLAAGVMPPAFKPRRDRPAWQLSLPLDWTASPFKDTNWCFHLHAWRMMDSLIRDWYRRRDPRALDEVIAYAMDWWRFSAPGARPR